MVLYIRLGVPVSLSSLREWAPAPIQQGSDHRPRRDRQFAAHGAHVRDRSPGTAMAIAFPAIAANRPRIPESIWRHHTNPRVYIHWLEAPCIRPSRWIS
jgi:hypothetical protein